MLASNVDSIEARIGFASLFVRVEMLEGEVQSLWLTNASAPTAAERRQQELHWQQQEAWQLQQQREAEMEVEPAAALATVPAAAPKPNPATPLGEVQLEEPTRLTPMFAGQGEGSPPAAAAAPAHRVASAHRRAAGPGGWHQGGPVGCGSCAACGAGPGAQQRL